MASDDEYQRRKEESGNVTPVVVNEKQVLELLRELPPGFEYLSTQDRALLIKHGYLPNVNQPNSTDK